MLDSQTKSNGYTPNWDWKLTLRKNDNYLPAAFSVICHFCSRKWYSNCCESALLKLYVGSFTDFINSVKQKIKFDINLLTNLELKKSHVIFISDVNNASIQPIGKQEISTSKTYNMIKHPKHMQDELIPNTNISRKLGISNNSSNSSVTIYDKFSHRQTYWRANPTAHSVVKDFSVK